jgi:DNA-directed RNA polymerase subunit M/transcription elongation factor TFIIS
MTLDPDTTNATGSFTLPPPDPLACRKCGSEAIATSWHLSDNDCPYQARLRDAGEHLHRTCRTCGFYWADATLDA